MISLLDQDFYSYTVGRLAYHFFGRTIASYKFIDRQNRIRYDGMGDELKEKIKDMGQLRYSSEELNFLQEYIHDTKYMEFLRSFQFDPKQVTVYNNEGYLALDIVGPWAETIFWEVPLLAAISELYYKIQGAEYRTFSEEHWYAHAKLQQLKQVDINEPFIEGGTRRRRSFGVQDAVLYGLKETCHSNKMIGTSNVYFAQKYGYKPVGTMSHQFVMACVAMWGLNEGTDEAKSMWLSIYKNNPGFFLTDTYTTPHFLKNLSPYEARVFDGFRQDSGDPLKIVRLICNRYKELGIEPRRKQILFSDSLTVDRIKEICSYIRCNGLGIEPVFMIGTNFTNDYSDQALNIVIKMTRFDNLDCVKLSDDKGKHTGKKKAIKAILDQIDTEVAIA